MSGCFRVFALAIVASAALILSGCATTGSAPTEPHDPFESFNRSMFTFNKGLDEAFFGPLAQGYAHITPQPAQAAVFNFFENLAYLTTAVNQLLQGKIERGFEDAGRFVINSTFGLAGLVDFASGIDMPRNREDFGQTLAVWGLGSGPYLELPFLGPNTFRSLPGLAADSATDLLTWVGSPVDYALSGVKRIDQRKRLDSAIKLRDKSSLDPYVFQREAYLQRRRHLIYDGNPPLDSPTPNK
jgi:phospholipid-binding lipoprotein MlaA